MNDKELLIDVNKILKNGDIKIYSDDGKLISLILPGENAEEIDEDNNYIKTVERDFREQADTILERLELSHLHVNALKER